MYCGCESPPIIAPIKTPLLVRNTLLIGAQYELLPWGCVKVGGLLITGFHAKFV